MIVDRETKGDYSAYMSYKEFQELLEYSHSFPTGQTKGKRWKRRSANTDEGYQEWLMCEYGDVVGEDIEVHVHRIYIHHDPRSPN